jgi:hypothetical protein
VAQNQSQTKTGKLRRSAIDGRTTRHAGYGLSQKSAALDTDATLESYSAEFEDTAPRRPK